MAHGLSPAPGVETAQPQQQLVPLADAACIPDHAFMGAAAENIANDHPPRRMANGQRFMGHLPRKLRVKMDFAAIALVDASE